MSEPTTKPRWWPYLALALGVVLAVAIGAAGFFAEFASRDVQYTIADDNARDAVAVQVTVQRVEAAARELVLQVLVVPEGSYADPGAEPATPAKDLVLDTSSLTTAPLTFPAHDRITARELRIPMDGAVSFFPFDRYNVELYVGVDAAGAPAPVQLTMIDHEPGFVTRPLVEGTTAHGGDGYVDAALQVKRSRSTLILAWFQVIVMWALGLCVLAGALHIVRGRLGLVWPALGWMAATLFALVGFRNAAPGLPPVGSLIDYCAFFWAEALIALSLVMATVHGVRART
ncbi:MAG TPA: DUF4436 family protein [Pseudonocardia sp.]|nr:DUF4436 family protein [Pseudonocardia sp.]